MPRHPGISRTIHEQKVRAMVRLADKAKCVPRDFYVPLRVTENKIDDYISRHLCNPGERIAYHVSVERVGVTYTMTIEEFCAAAHAQEEAKPQPKNKGEKRNENN